jgi:hypothetical protein
LPAADAAVGVAEHCTPDAAMSSAFLYLAIVAIWAFVLIPRWLRRPQLLGREATEPDGLAYDDHDDDSSDGQPFSVARKIGSLLRGGHLAEGDAAAGYADADQEPQPSSRRAPAPLTRSKVLQARRRLLTMLVTLTAVAAACTYLKLTSWWACVPPAGMLGTYLLLLREAALADAEQARWRAAEYERVQAARQRARGLDEERSAEVIDISARLSDQLYDQYADATIRAVGD